MAFTAAGGSLPLESMVSGQQVQPTSWQQTGKSIYVEVIEMVSEIVCDWRLRPPGGVFDNH